MATAQDAMAVCEQVLARKAAKATSCKVGGVKFTSLLYPDSSNNGWCQRAVRLVYQAATGKSMPGAGCCAGQTCANLIAAAPTMYAWIAKVCKDGLSFEDIKEGRALLSQAEGKL